MRNIQDNFKSTNHPSSSYSDWSNERWTKSADKRAP